MTPIQLCRDLTVSLLSGEWRADAVLARAEHILGLQKEWLSRGIERLCVRFPGPQAPNFDVLHQALLDDVRFVRDLRVNHARIHHRIFAPLSMAPQPGAPAGWPVPKLELEADLCRWLDVPENHLAWLADVHGRECRVTRERLRHYTYTWIRKRSGGWRLLEIPKSKLKSMQRTILADLLDKIPAHPAAHGFRKHGSVHEYVLPHTHQEFVLRMDLADFFHSVPASRVHALFATVGYSEPIARLLTGLCTNCVPTPFMRLPEKTERIAATHAQQLRTPHLPQGAPTSPALANLCAYRMDVRLSALAKRFDWHYTRYADDLLFSGRRMSHAITQQFPIWVGAVAIEEGFTANMRKTRMMASGVRQCAAGLVLNTKVNIARDDYDNLKALLFNCGKHGPASQNREAHPRFREHLLGRVGHMSQINSARGEKLMRLFERIEW